MRIEVERGEEIPAERLWELAQDGWAVTGGEHATDYRGDKNGRFRVFLAREARD